MKKIVLVLISVILVVGLTGCVSSRTISEKKALDEFSKNGFTTLDITSELKDVNIKSAYAVNNGKIQIEYYIYKNKEVAKKVYKYDKEEFKKTKSKRSKEKETSGKIYDKYTLTLSDTYDVVTRKDNTLIYASVSLNDMKVLKKMLGKIGY